MAKREQLVDSIRMKLALHSFAEGQNVPEESLAAEFGVSRTPIREALLQLECQGLVVNEPNRGFKVTILTVDRIRGFFEAASQILPPAVAKTTSQSRDGVEALAKLYDAISEAANSGNVTGFYKSYVGFLRIVSGGSRNWFFERSCDTLIGFLVFVKARDMGDDASDLSMQLMAEDQRHLRNILDACEQKDASVAGEMMQQLLENARMRVVSTII